VYRIKITVRAKGNPFAATAVRLSCICSPPLPVTLSSFPKNNAGLPSKRGRLVLLFRQGTWRKVLYTHTHTHTHRLRFPRQTSDPENVGKTIHSAGPKGSRLQHDMARLMILKLGTKNLVSLERARRPTNIDKK